MGGYNDNDDNVVARTPAKNAINLDNLKQSVMELVNPKVHLERRFLICADNVWTQDKDYLNESVVIPRRYHRTLLGDKSIFIHDIENKTNCRIRFPDKETASDVITIFGPESQIQIAATMLLVCPTIIVVFSDSTSPRTTFPSKPIWLFHPKQNWLVYAHLQSLLHLSNKSSASCKSPLFRILNRRQAALQELIRRRNVHSNSAVSVATVTYSYPHARCSSSTCLITTSMSIHHQLRTHTSAVIHLQMRSLTLIARCYPPCLGLVVSTPPSYDLFFLHSLCGRRLR